MCTSTGKLVLKLDVLVALMLGEAGKKEPMPMAAASNKKLYLCCSASTVNTRTPQTIVIVFATSRQLAVTYGNANRSHSSYPYTSRLVAFKALESSNRESCGARPDSL